MKMRTFRTEIELACGDRTVEYQAVFTLSPRERQTRAEPGADAAVEDVEVWYVQRVPCPAHRFLRGGEGDRACAACRIVRERRPELDDLADREELLVYALDRLEADEGFAADLAYERARDERAERRGA
jgi:hypothetical protein